MTSVCRQGGEEIIKRFNNFIKKLENSEFEVSELSSPRLPFSCVCP